MTVMIQQFCRYANQIIKNIIIQIKQITNQNLGSFELKKNWTKIENKLITTSGWDGRNEGNNIGSLRTMLSQQLLLRVITTGVISCYLFQVVN